MAKKKQKQMKVTLVRSPIGYQPRHRECARGLGLTRMHKTVVVEDTPSTRGMVNKIDYMVRVEEA
ncbi:MAG: 50S ribosomal protein L30 [Xanthomonadales bacterium]|nr:50S ribosomal protein L30 [Xanthomonadales bacterium]